MAWPGITDFSEAVQNPRVCFKGADLESGTAAVNRRGMPLVYSGAFACVYQVSAGGRTYAVRCFTREVKDQQARYNALSEYLAAVFPPSFVQFEYVERGIGVRGSWYPVVRMEWVDGEPLSSYVGDNANDPDALRRTAAQWRGGPTASLRGLGIAHNDLQHGNVMVQSDGRLRLVDYDGMFLPRFRGERSPELGHKNYQHPLRTADDYDAYVDHFPALVVYLSLLAIAADPVLWADFNNEDNLIFTSARLRRPRRLPPLRAAAELPRPVRRPADGAPRGVLRPPRRGTCPTSRRSSATSRSARRPPLPPPAPPATSPPSTATPPAPQTAPSAPAGTGAPAAPAPQAPAPPAPGSSGTGARPAARPARRPVPGERKKVALGVLVTVAATVAGCVAVMAWAVSAQGW